MPFLWTLLGLIAFAFIYSAIDTRFFTVTKYCLKTDRLKSENEGFSFVVLADLHNNAFGKNNSKLIEGIAGLRPDFIITAGDIVSKGRSCCPGNAFDLMKSLVKQYPVYYVMGNHEQYFISLTEEEQDRKPHLKNSWLEYYNGLNALGVCFLDNKTVSTEYGGETISITGISIEREYYGLGKASEMPADYIESLADRRPESEFKLMITHNPVYFREYAGWGADLVITGHMHGGVIRLGRLGGLLSPQYRIFPKYNSGLYEEYESAMIVSRGLGTHSNMPRVFNRPELIYVQITGANRMPRNTV
jgi:predicted MPP superfamily phosphohydrolase